MPLEHVHVSVKGVLDRCFLEGGVGVVVSLSRITLSQVDIGYVLHAVGADKRL